MITPDSNYRDLLRYELERRSSANIRYSLTAFAKDLGLAPSRLSEVLSGKQGLSREVATRIAGIVGLTTQETDLFCDLVDAEHARSNEKRVIAKIRLQELAANWEYSTYNENVLRALSEVYHFSIMQALQSDICSADPLELSRKLGITEHQAKMALERLLTLGLIAVNAAGKIKPVKEMMATFDNVPSEALRSYQRQMLAKATEALETQSVQNRNFSSNIIGIRKSDLPKAKDALKRFRRKFTKDLETGRGHDAVYCLNIQLFELTKDQA